MGQQAVLVSGRFAHVCRISCELGHTVPLTIAGSVPRWGSAGYRLVWGGLDQDNWTLVLRQAGPTSELVLSHCTKAGGKAGLDEGVGNRLRSFW